MVAIPPRIAALLVVVQSNVPGGAVAARVRMSEPPLASSSADSANVVNLQRRDRVERANGIEFSRFMETSWMFVVLSSSRAEPFSSHVTKAYRGGRRCFDRIRLSKRDIDCLNRTFIAKNGHSC